MNRPLIMTLLVRDEDDIVERNIEYHLSRGVSHIFATDNLSVDGTTDILLKYQRLGLLTYRREESNTHDQANWVTRMAHQAQERFPSSIIFHVDADEFWWPERGSLPEVLGQAFESFTGIGQVRRTNYVGPNVHVTSRTFLDRCVYRQARPENVLGKPLPGKVCHLADPNIFINHGNHQARWPNGRAQTRTIQDLTVLHFPNRSVDQFIEKTLRGAHAVRNNHNLPDGVCRTWLALDSAIRLGRFEREFPDQIVTERDIQKWLASGDLVPCDRLRAYFTAMQKMLPSHLRSVQRVS